MLLRNWGCFFSSFHVNSFPKVSECHSRTGISDKDREPGFPLPKDKNSEPFFARLFLSPIYSPPPSPKCPAPDGLEIGAVLASLGSASISVGRWTDPMS